jgi:hypothetical protein
MAQPTKIVLPPLRLTRAELGIVGDTPLIVHSWNPKAKGEMLLRQMKQPVYRETKDPVQAFMQSMYRTDRNHYGLPSVGVKNAMVTACTSVEGITKTAARQAFFIAGERGKTKAAFADLYSPQDLVRIRSPNPPGMREDMVRLSGVGNSADLRYRAEFWPWGAKLLIDYNENVLELDQLLNLLNTAGFGVGLCEWRPERDGQSGRFHIARDDEMVMLDSRDWMAHQEPQVPDVAAWLRTMSGAEQMEEPQFSPRRRGASRRRAVPAPANDPVFETQRPAANDDHFHEPPAAPALMSSSRRRRRRSQMGGSPA